MDRQTACIYEERADEWVSRRAPQDWALSRLSDLAERLPAGARVADLGCGPGWYADALRERGLRTVGLDLSAAMLREMGRRHPRVDRVRGDLAALPLARESLDAAVAVNCYMHLPESELPGALAHLHAAVRVGGSVQLTLPTLPVEQATPAELARGSGRRALSGDRFAGRLFTAFTRERILRMFEGAGFEQVGTTSIRGDFWLWVSACRARTLPDYVRLGLRVLVCGLNPSIYSAESGVPYGRPGNRFWRAAREAGLLSVERDPIRALAEGVGFSDFVKRATRSASELARDEYAAGVARLEDTVRFYAPELVCFAGLDGWRKAVDRGARPGFIEGGFGGRPAYLMPSPSGRNAHARLEDLVAHWRVALGERSPRD